MKQVKRVFALMLALLMLFTGADWTFGLGQRAYADNVETRGSTDLEDTPEELLTLGEWVYWVEDGTATIAGYNGLSETSLKIPEKLGGYPVTGIGQRVFSANTALRNVQFHTNVTRIAEDAFEGLSGVTLSAYHGAFALRYAAQNGLGANNLSTQCVFADGVIDLIGAPAGSYSDLTETGAVFTASLATYLDVGQILAFPRSNAYPTGLAVRVDALTQSGEFR